MKKKSWYRMIILLILGLFSLIPFEARAEAEISIDEQNFPDAKFRSYVLKKIDKDKSTTLSKDEMDAVTSVNVYSSGIKEMTGIEYFPNLTTLDCRSNSLVELDLSGCTAIENLSCFEGTGYHFK